MDKDTAYELLTYMVSSSVGLKQEPAIYGPLRLIEASQRLIHIMLKTCDAENEQLKQLDALIEAHKYDCMTDETAFYNMLDDISMQLVKCF